MKVITIKQPWATLIAKGYKEYEFRTWKTKYRGDILIHAGKGTDKEAMTRFEDLKLEYPKGCIIAKAKITDCIYNVAILFEEENINTLEMAGELLLTILSSVAQQESETISSHVKLGIKMKQQRGELIGYNGCLGYTYDKENKSYTTDPITHKRVINMGEENQYYIKERHTAIIEPELFDKVQQILEKRVGSRSKGKRRGNYSRKYPFSSRIYCGFCGTILTRRNWNSKTKNETPVWHCMNFVKKENKNVLNAKQ